MSKVPYYPALAFLIKGGTSAPLIPNEFNVQVVTGTTINFIIF
jgi:hypothetical protein